MKPSERRALREQKQKEREQQLVQDTRSENHEAPDTEEKKKKQSIWQTYPKLIAFIICVAVFLLVFGPWNIYHISQKISERINNEDDKTNIPMETVYKLSEMGHGITWMHFEKYNYTDMSYKTKDTEYIKHEYPVGDTGYVVWVGGTSEDEEPEYIYLIDMAGTGKQIDIRKEDAEKFVQKTMQQRED